MTSATSEKTNVSTNTKTRGGLKVRAFIKAGGLSGINHNRAIARSGLKVRVFIKAGGLSGINHNRTLAS